MQRLHEESFTLLQHRHDSEGGGKIGREPFWSVFRTVGAERAVRTQVVSTALLTEESVQFPNSRTCELLLFLGLDD